MPTAARVYVPTTALAQTATCTDDTLHIFLTDGRTLGVPLLWSPRLFAATPAQRENIEIGGGGLSLHWPDIDEDLPSPVSWQAATGAPPETSPILFLLSDYTNQPPLKLWQTK